MALNRREHIAMVLAASLYGCSIKRQSKSAKSKFIPDIEPLGGLGLVVMQNGQKLFSYMDGFSSGLDRTEKVKTRKFTSSSPFRVASMSKVATLMTALAMNEANLLDLDEDINMALGTHLRHPQYPSTPITLRQLLSHRSGISDPDVYWTQPSQDIRNILKPGMFKNAKPGEWFEYANINYGIAATVMEARANRRFDRLTQDYVFGPLGLDVGFNWSGVSRLKRQNGATLYRLFDREMTVQTDGPDILSSSGPALFGNDPNFDLQTYQPGHNGTLFSPQGGLRASLDDLLVLAKTLENYPDLYSVKWRFNGRNGADENGHFVSFGAGLYVYPPELSPIPGQLMVGHHGEAYGMFGGLWHLPNVDAQIVHAVTATPQTPKPYHPGPPAIAAESRAFFDVAMNVLAI